MSTKHSSARAAGKRGFSLHAGVRFFLTSSAAAYVIAAWSLGSAHAQTPGLAGRWSASPLRVDWQIGDWGPACGPRPSGGGAPGGVVTVTTSGAELVMSGAGRTYSTTECWEQYPGLARVSHSSSARRWSNVCQTPPGDPRQARVATTIVATDSQIHFDETGQYQFVLRGQNCTASLRRTRLLTRLPDEGAAPPSSASAAPEAAAKPVAQAGRCATKGLPERLEVRPSRKLMRPGETFTFRAAVVDAAGCHLGITPSWKALGAAGVLELTGPGKVTVREDAPEGETRLQASVGDRAVGVVVEIVSRERYDALLTHGTFNAEGESAEAAVARIATESIGARSGVVREEARGRKTVFVAIVGTLALLLGIVGLLFVRRSQRQRKAALAMPARSTAAAPPPPPKSAENKLCPTCREEFPANAEFCAFDGNRLVPLTRETGIGPAGGVCPVCGQGYDPGVAACPKHNEPLVPALVYAQRQTGLPVTRRICPVCGTQFSSDSQFCGKCGAALVPVN